jgi:hypothetical protein
VSVALGNFSLQFCPRGCELLSTRGKQCSRSKGPIYIVTEPPHFVFEFSTIEFEFREVDSQLFHLINMRFGTVLTIVITLVAASSSAFRFSSPSKLTRGRYGPFAHHYRNGVICRRLKPAITLLRGVSLSTAANALDMAYPEDIKETLLEQGIDWEDVLAMQAEFALNNSTYGTKGNKVDKDYGVSNEDTELNISSAARGRISRPLHLGTTITSDGLAQGDFLETLRPKSTARKLTAQQHMGSQTGVRARDMRRTTPMEKQALAGLTRQTANSQTRCLANNVPTSIRCSALRSAASKIPKHVSTEGVTIEAMLSYLVDAIGFPQLFEATSLKCFQVRPTVASSLKVLRQRDMEWARQKLQYLYIAELRARGNGTSQLG